MGEKEEYCEATRSKLDELEAQIGIVKDKAEKAKAETREEYHEQFQLLRSKHQEVLDRLQELEETEDESWRDHQPAVDGALSELQHSLANILFRMG